MPSSYTAALYEGKDVTFEEFVMRCARGMGALIMMREEPLDAPIPEQFEPDDYHAKKIEDAEWQLRYLDGVTDEAVRRQADTEYEQAHIGWEEARRTKAERRTRYEDMLAKVRAWEPPTADHVGFKDFMIEQIAGSMEFDCPYDWPSYYPEPERQTVEEWKAAKRAKAERDLAYHREEHAKEVERARDRSEWVQELRRSLGVNA